MNKAELSKIYSFARKNKAYIYGSAASEAQKTGRFRREFGDVDLQLFTNRGEFRAKELVKDLGRGFRVDKLKTMLTIIST